MKKVKKIIILTILYTNSLAQSIDKEIKVLKVGDLCPNFEFNDIINYPVKIARLSDFKGKLVILDFWATWCSPCIDATPKLDYLQRKFNKEIVIIPISYENTEAVRSFMAENSILKNLSLPSVTNEKSLQKYFPHRFIPHEVWIDSAGIVLGFTGHEEVNEKNIIKFLSSSKLQVNQKKDNLNFDESKPLLAGAIGPNVLEPENLLTSSVVLKYIKGLPSISGAPIVLDSVSKIYCFNTSIQSLYHTALGTKNNMKLKAADDPDFPLRLVSRLIWEAKDSTLFTWPGRTLKSILSVNPEDRLFSYELILPKKDSLQLNSYMASDLNRYFGSRFRIEGVRESRWVNCWVLERTSQGIDIKSKGGRKEVRARAIDNKILVRNSKINEFLFWWTYFGLELFPVAIINETNYDFPIDLELDVDPKNFQAVNNALTEYGLKFKMAKRKLDMIIIRDLK